MVNKCCKILNHQKHPLERHCAVKSSPEGRAAFSLHVKLLTRPCCFHHTVPVGGQQLLKHGPFTITNTLCILLFQS